MSDVDRKKEMVRCYKHVFGSDEGKRVLQHMMRTCRVLSTVTCSHDPQMSAFYDGQRSVVLSILRMIETKVDDVDPVIEAIRKDPFAHILDPIVEN